MTRFHAQRKLLAMVAIALSTIVVGSSTLLAADKEELSSFFADADESPFSVGISDVKTFNTETETPVVQQKQSKPLDVKKPADFQPVKMVFPPAPVRVVKDEATSKKGSIKQTAGQTLAVTKTQTPPKKLLEVFGASQMEPVFHEKGSQSEFDLKSLDGQFFSNAETPKLSLVDFEKDVVEQTAAFQSEPAPAPPVEDENVPQSSADGDDEEIPPVPPPADGVNGDSSAEPSAPASCGPTCSPSGCNSCDCVDSCCDCNGQAGNQAWADSAGNMYSRQPSVVYKKSLPQRWAAGWRNGWSNVGRFAGRMNPFGRSRQ